MPDEPKNDNSFGETPSNDTPNDQNVTPETPSVSEENQTEATESVTETSFSSAPSETTPEVNQPDSAPVEDSVSSGPNMFGSAEQSTTEAPQPALSAMTETSKKKKKGLIVGLIIAAALVLLGGGGASAYFFWYQNPDKVVFDSLSNAMSAKSTGFTGNLKVEKDGATLYDVTLTGKAAESLDSEFNLDAKINNDGADFNLKGDLITDKDGNLYVRVNEVSNLLAQIAGKENAQIYTAYFGEVIEMVDGKWVKVSSDDLDSLDADYANTQQCLTDAAKSLSNDKSVKNELTELFKKNKFIIVEKSLGSKSVNGVDSIGFELRLSKEKFVSFVKGIGDTQVGKALKECDDSYDFSSIDESDLESDSKNDTKLELWASRFGHQLTEINITGSGEEGNGKIVIHPKFNEEVKVTVPTDATGADKVVEKFQTTLQRLFGQ